MASKAPSPDTISASEFQALLDRYPACVAAISDAKGAKPGQKTLASLDQYRYGTALDAFGSGNRGTPMSLDDVKTLVEWKLRHGKFRPALMKHVESNDSAWAKQTIQDATKHYRDKSDVAAALDTLTKLKGIGPATASLLLAVHDPDKVVFFADEAFYWLCCGGSKAPIKYNLKEYRELRERAAALADRLHVRAVDIERVAFVLMREQPQPLGEEEPTAVGNPPAGVPDKGAAKKLPAKRKISSPGGDPAADSSSLPRLCHLLFPPAMAICAGPLPILSSMVDTRSRSKKAEPQPFPGFCPGPIQLTPRFVALKESLTSGKEAAVSSSWRRLLRQLPAEINAVSSLGSTAVPTISFTDIGEGQQSEAFLRDLRKRGVGIIRGVVPENTAVAWSKETGEYVRQQNPQAGSAAAGHDVFWSPAQVKARAHTNLLAAQRFVMSIWTSADPSARVTTNFPISYADRMGVRRTGGLEGSSYAHVDGGSVERWEPDGYGRAGTYKDIFQGRWEDYDPWESSTRLAVTSDLYHRASACSIFRMFQGWLALQPIPSGPGSVQVCPLPRLATTYFLLRPFFSPSSQFSTTTTTTTATSESEDWLLNRPQNSILHGALPSYAQEITPALHPHLQLARSLVSVPDLEPGDYLIWHPDLIHSVPPTTTTTSDAETSSSSPSPVLAPHTSMYLPACPLTQTNALYLARQRKAFLLGAPGPDFGGGRGESGHAGRPGVREVNDAGGDDGLRAMGLLPWDEEESDSDREREVLAMANGLLFPDLYDMW
ncbi:hypothetical protein C8A05DRAFT_14179 [Staphylotrichum tortipilum]|uniref:DUF1479-domain-containing protein n=1 Tax=Staphylotrichum tortipilum TaxID=2831512 RepID=A0AAN6MP18_9PEZI|nr:hypothetical protein C8A05DRAFT_14179 [Staphylotrichum longicolle]